MERDIDMEEFQPNWTSETTAKAVSDAIKDADAGKSDFTSVADTLHSIAFEAGVDEYDILDHIDEDALGILQDEFGTVDSIKLWIDHLEPLYLAEFNESKRVQEDSQSVVDFISERVAKIPNGLTEEEFDAKFDDILREVIHKFDDTTLDKRLTIEFPEYGTVDYLPPDMVYIGADGALYIDHISDNECGSKGCKYKNESVLNGFQGYKRFHQELKEFRADMYDSYPGSRDAKIRLLEQIDSLIGLVEDMWDGEDLAIGIKNALNGFQGYKRFYQELKEFRADMIERYPGSKEALAETVEDIDSLIGLVEAMWEGEDLDAKEAKMKSNEEFEYEWEEYQVGVKGDFMKALAHAFDLADSKNVEKLANAFPDVYEVYAKFHGDVLNRLPKPGEELQFKDLKARHSYKFGTAVQVGEAVPEERYGFTAEQIEKFRDAGYVTKDDRDREIIEFPAGTKFFVVNIDHDTDYLEVSVVGVVFEIYDPDVDMSYVAI